MCPCLQHIATCKLIAVLVVENPYDPIPSDEAPIYNVLQLVSPCVRLAAAAPAGTCCSARSGRTDPCHRRGRCRSRRNGTAACRHRRISCRSGMNTGEIKNLNNFTHSQRNYLYVMQIFVAFGDRTRDMQLSCLPSHHRQ